ncbi:MAG: hypothetical protein A2X84_03125 [Desulfuromonadaceae bacterium GWC2_58_13]|nr:MAG: hypothetical protein A2X84_03125 [Desulfuromonadaceae bacterium GWC2_58_13]
MNNVAFIYLTLVTGAYLLLFRRSRDKTRQSLRVAGQSLVRMAPMLAAIFGLIGLFQVFIPADLIERWLGASSSGTALLTGGLIGAIAIGPPVAAFPLAGSMLDAGAWPPAAAAFVVSWISVGVLTLPFEAEIFGLRFALSRNVIAFLTALLIGLLIGWLT